MIVSKHAEKPDSCSENREKSGEQQAVEEEEAGEDSDEMEEEDREDKDTVGKEQKDEATRGERKQRRR